MPIKIAMIGAGSVGFTRALTKDILAVPELVNTEFAFTDISKNMLEGADHVFCMIRQGGLGTFQTDIEHTTKVRSRPLRG